MVHAAAEVMFPPWSQPVANAELNIAWRWAREVDPSVMVHEGMSTRESRGMETSSARVRSADRWATIVVSERIPTTPAVPPMTPSTPLRWSDPISRTFTGLPACGSTGVGVGVSWALALGLGAGPASVRASATVTLRSRWTYAAATPAPVRASTPVTASTTALRARRLRRAAACLIRPGCGTIGTWVGTERG